MKRSLLLLLIATVACDSGTSPTAQQPTTRRVTLISNDAPKDVPRRNGGIVLSTLQVTGLAGTLTDVKVTLDIDQGPACELVAAVTHPDGTRVVLLDVDRPPAGLGCPNRLVTTFPTLTPTPYAADLTSFRGKPATGTWTLLVGDERTGLLVAPPYVLRAWQLELTVQQ